MLYLPDVFGESLMDEMLNDLVFPEDEFERALYGRKNPFAGKKAANLMKTDVREHEDSYEIEIDLPGFDKEDINLNLKEGYLTVNASKSVDKEGKKHGKVIRKERYEGAMTRTFYVGEQVTQDEIKAAFKNGVLKMTLPKKDEKKELPSGNIAIEG
uniref:Molecular chaperone (Small heat shock protein) n=1 Tax=uncultured bacterium Contigcl_1565 TaxID=1393654 RepID=W0FSG4_9BACT|nr:molecular chaperone (small heat shock protein) [uncultured bacterium Contigcl_1565]